VVKLMYFDTPHAEAMAPAPAGDARLLLSINGLAVLVLGILPQPLMALCAYAMQASLQ
jgi:NADH-quinone oxidoreductase subunit N